MSQDTAIVDAIMSNVPAQEAAPTPQPETTPEALQESAQEPDLSGSMAQILKREAQLAKRKAELREVEETANKWRGYKERATKGDYAAALDALSELGVDYDKLTAYLIDDAQQDPQKQEFRRLQEEIAAIREEAKAQAAAQKAAEESEAVEAFKDALNNTVNSMSEELEFVREAGQDAIDLAFEVVQLHWEQTQTILPREDALRMVEAHLEKQHEESLNKLKNMKKFSKYFAQEKQEAAANRQVQSPQLPSPTQANNLPPQQSNFRGTQTQPGMARTLAGQSGAFSSNAAAPSTEEELRAAAIAALTR